MNTNNPEKKARRGELMVINGSQTKPHLKKIMFETGKPQNMVVLNKSLTAECFLRLARRQCQDNLELLFLILLIAKRSGDLEKLDHDSMYGYSAWRFREARFRILDISDPNSPHIKNLISKIRHQFTDDERKELRDPVIK